MKEKMQRINLNEFDLDKSGYSASTIARIYQYIKQNHKNLAPDEIESLICAELSGRSIVDDDEQICDSQGYNTQPKRFR